MNTIVRGMVCILWGNLQYNYVLLLRTFITYFYLDFFIVFPINFIKKILFKKSKQKSRNEYVDALAKTSMDIMFRFHLYSNVTKFPQTVNKFCHLKCIL